MANPAMFLAPLNGNLAYRDRSGIGTLTGTGSVRWMPAEGARVNYAVNGSAEDSSTFGSHWNAFTGATVDRTSGGGSHDEYFVRVDAPGTTAYNGMNYQAYVINDPWILPIAGQQIWVRFKWRDASGTNAPVAIVGFRSWDGSSWAVNDTDSAVVPPDEWTEYVLGPIVAQPSSGATWQVFWGSENTTDGSQAFSVDVDELMFTTEDPTGWDYFDGSTGGVWIDPITGILGTAHASPSVERAVAWVEEGTTNLVTNPWFATNTTGWSATNAAIARSTAYAYQGPAAATLTATTTNATATTSITAAASSHTAQWIVRNAHTVARTVQLKYNGSNIGSTASVDPGETLTITAPFTGTGGAANLELVVTDSANTEVMVIYYAGAEAKSYATSPCPAINASGTVQTGYAWTGTAHASTSTRTANTDSVDQDGTNRIDPASGSIAFRYKRNIDTAAEEIIMTSGVVGSGTDYLELGIDSTDHFYAEWNSNNAGANRVTSTGTISVDTEYLLYTDWDGTAIRVSIDNGAFDTDTRDAVEGDWSTGDLTIQAA